MAILGAGLCATALPGCAWSSNRVDQVQMSQESKAMPETTAKASQKASPGRYTGLEESEPLPSPPRRPAAATLSNQQASPGQEQAEQPQPDLPPGKRLPEYQGPPLPLPPLDASPLAAKVQMLPQPVGKNDALSVRQVPEPPAEKEEPLVSALRYLLNNQPKEAVKDLESFDGTKQDLFMRLLAALATLHEKSVDQLSPDEKAALENQLQGLEVALRNPSELIIAKLCLCERIGGYGQYKPVPDGHVFQAGTPGNPWGGELVKVYVELRNITWVPRDSYYVAALHGTIRIRDAEGLVWSYNLRNREPALEKVEQPRSDWFRSYDFFVPNMAPGKYTLTIEVADEMHQPHRLAQKSVEFVVAPAGGQ